MQFRERLQPAFRRFASVALAIDVFHGSVVVLCETDTKQQQKLTFFIKKRRAVERPENDEEGPEKDVKDRKRVRSVSQEVNFTSQQLQQLPQLFM